MTDTSCFKVPHNLFCVLLYAYAVSVIIYELIEVVEELWILLLHAFADVLLS